MIEIEHLSRRFGATVAVDDVSFEVKPGEIVGFLGPNGAGKTTTMRVTAGLIYPHAGTVRVNGLDVLEDPVSVRRQMGYLPEDTPLYDDMPVIDFLRFIGSIRGIRRADLSRKVSEMVEVCSLGNMAYKDIGELSRGYRQRVGLAQALIHDPPVLILDEPTSGLDPTQIVEIRRLVRDIGRQKAILFSTHILDEAQKTSDRIVVISGGRIVAEGSADTLARQVHGRDIYQVEFSGDLPALKDKLAHLLEVATEKEAEGGWAHISFASKTNDDVSADIFDAAVAVGGRLRRLEKQAATLEEVFLELTRGGEEEAQA
ncbi:MAG: hypothetical protein B1H03_02465 [Planctomycetales bacterium 4484_113]|nr:MAG: hypothetical protein B1H03_02465 [Planctomycetales bacterium 4484_113]